LTPPQRQQLVLHALAGQSISQLATSYHVSRKFVYQQLQQARQALDHAFRPADDQAEPVLFYLPVTKTWLRQLVLGLVLLCHSSLRGVVELLHDLFDYSMSLGTAHNILQQAVTTARQINLHEDLSGVRIGTHDEIFQTRQPVLVGADVDSTYCYLLSLEEHRDADTWGVRLLELQERGFRPQATIADFGSGLRAAQDEVLPGIPCRGDIFHVLHDAMPLVRYLDNRAYDAIAACDQLQRKLARHEFRTGRKSIQLTAKLRFARPVEARAVALADEVALLVRWLREDILTVAGPDYPTRCALYDWVVAELRAREAQCPHRIRPVRSLLENQRPVILAFAAGLDQELTALAQEYAVPAATVRSLLQVQALPPGNPQRWQRQEEFWHLLGERYLPLEAAVAALALRTVRASSVIENVNSRLRNYFFLRRQLGPDYLVLLQFFLNHHRFVRSERAERVGRSPVELLTGEAQPHWLESLGYQLFSRN
jgi:hypothetical protein